MRAQLIETTKDYLSMSAVGASAIFADAMASLAVGRRYNLGLATGNTMIDLYDQLAAKFNAARADLSLLSTWNLDEYSTDGRTAVPHDQPLSYWRYMHEKLFSKFDPALGFREENAHFPDPAAPEVYDPAIWTSGRSSPRSNTSPAFRSFPERPSFSSTRSRNAPARFHRSASSTRKCGRCTSRPRDRFSSSCSTT